MPQFKVGSDLLTAKHVDDVNMTRLGKNIDDYVSRVQTVFGACELQECLISDGVAQMKQDLGISWKNARPG